MPDWSVLLTSSVVSACITGLGGALLKSRFDQKLEVNKLAFERERMVYSVNTQKEIEVLKSNISQLSALNQKNIDYFQSINQTVQTKRIDAIESVWEEYLDIRIYVSPIINLFSIILPEEYLKIIDEIEIKDRLNLKSVNEREIPKGLDTVPLLNKLEEQRPFLGELLYYKFRSSILILLRLRLVYSDIVNKKHVYLWHEDSLLLDHLRVVFSTDTVSEGEIPLKLDSSLKLLATIGMVEFELSKTMENIISGETIANISLERARKITQGFLIK